jgi:hypothetical protein
VTDDELIQALGRQALDHIRGTRRFEAGERRPVYDLDHDAWWVLVDGLAVREALWQDHRQLSDG